MAADIVCARNEAAEAAIERLESSVYEVLAKLDASNEAAATMAREVEALKQRAQQMEHTMEVAVAFNGSDRRYSNPLAA